MQQVSLMKSSISMKHSCKIYGTLQFTMSTCGNDMATKNWIAYALPIIQIMQIPYAKSHKQMRLRLIYRERVGIISTESTWQTGIFSVCHFCYIYYLCAKWAKLPFSQNIAIHRNSSGLKISAVVQKMNNIRNRAAKDLLCGKIYVV